MNHSGVRHSPLFYGLLILVDMESTKKLNIANISAIRIVLQILSDVSCSLATQLEVLLIYFATSLLGQISFNGFYN